jgi:hypothetical protein
MDFYALLQKELEEIKNETINTSCEKHNLTQKQKHKQSPNDSQMNNTTQKECLITYEPLEKYFVTLKCGHTFNYEPLYNEIYQQKKKYNNYETTYLSKYEIKCPYCRNIQHGLLPPHIDFDIVSHVNKPYKYCMNLYTCEYNNPKGEICGKCCFGKYCIKHVKRMKEQSKYNKCSFILTTGKRKGECCNIKTLDTYCKRHQKINTNSDNKKQTNKTITKCKAILKTGKRKGEQCGASVKVSSDIHSNNILNNLIDTQYIYCKRHAK